MENVISKNSFGSTYVKMCSKVFMLYLFILSCSSVGFYGMKNPEDFENPEEDEEGEDLGQQQQNNKNIHNEKKISLDLGGEKDKREFFMFHIIPFTVETVEEDKENKECIKYFGDNLLFKKDFYITVEDNGVNLDDIEAGIDVCNKEIEDLIKNGKLAKILGVDDTKYKISSGRCGTEKDFKEKQAEKEGKKIHIEDVKEIEKFNLCLCFYNMVYNDAYEEAKANAENKKLCEETIEEGLLDKKSKPSELILNKKGYTYYAYLKLEELSDEEKGKKYIEQHKDEHEAFIRKKKIKERFGGEGEEIVMDEYAQILEDRFEEFYKGVKNNAPFMPDHQFGEGYNQFDEGYGYNNPNEDYEEHMGGNNQDNNIEIPQKIYDEEPYYEGENGNKEQENSNEHYEELH